MTQNAVKVIIYHNQKSRIHFGSILTNVLATWNVIFTIILIKKREFKESSIVIYRTFTVFWFDSLLNINFGHNAFMFNRRPKNWRCSSEFTCNRVKF